METPPVPPSPASDRIALQRTEQLIEGRNQILELIATAAPLEDTLDQIVRLIEAHSDGMLGSILLLDHDGIHVRHGAAPSLPRTFVEAINGKPIGPVAGSCGTAAWRAEQVISGDIRTDPLWVEYRVVADADGLRACWSTPIFSSQKAVLGTFAMYYREPRTPQESEQRLIEVATHLAGIAIEQRRVADALRTSEARYRDLFDHSSDLILIVGPDMSLHFVNAAFRATMEYDTPAISQIRLPEILHPDERAICLQTFQRVTSGDHVDHIETGFVTRSGRKIDVEGNCSCRYADGKLVTVRGIFRDVTTRKAGERKIAEQLDELRRWQKVTLGREDRVQELKREVNELREKLGEPPAYEAGT